METRIGGTRVAYDVSDSGPNIFFVYGWAGSRALESKMNHNPSAESQDEISCGAFKGE